MWIVLRVGAEVLVFWVATLCGLVGRYQRFGGAYCLHLQNLMGPSMSICLSVSLSAAI
jgi:hypothetical protein